MEWIKLFIYCIVAYNLAFWAVYKNGPFDIFDNIRAIFQRYTPKFSEVFECMNCCGTWIGIILSLINLILFPSIRFTPSMVLFNEAPWYWILIIDASFTSGIVWLIHNIQEMMEKDDE